MVSIKNIFDPQAIVIGGGLINSKQQWLTSAKKKFQKQCNDYDGIAILSAKYNNQSGVIGAARLAFMLYN